MYSSVRVCKLKKIKSHLSIIAIDKSGKVMRFFKKFVLNICYPKDGILLVWKLCKTWQALSIILKH